MGSICQSTLLNPGLLKIVEVELHSCAFCGVCTRVLSGSKKLPWLRSWRRCEERIVLHRIWFGRASENWRDWPQVPGGVDAQLFGWWSVSRQGLGVRERSWSGHVFFCYIYIRVLWRMVVKGTGTLEQTNTQANTHTWKSNSSVESCVLSQMLANWKDWASQSGSYWKCA